MKLYHWTAEENLLGIVVSGLTTAHADYYGKLTDGTPVVWLTQNESRVPSAADLALFDRAAVEDDKPELLGRLCCLVIRATCG